MSDAAGDVLSEVPANGTDSSRGDYLPTVKPPAGLEQSAAPAEGEAR